MVKSLSQISFKVAVSLLRIASDSFTSNVRISSSILVNTRLYVVKVTLPRMIICCCFWELNCRPLFPSTEIRDDDGLRYDRLFNDTPVVVSLSCEYEAV